MNRRPRRNRKSESVRTLVAETKVSVDDFIFPLFLLEGSNRKIEVDSMPGIFRYSIDLLLKEIEECLALGITVFDIFPVVEDVHKDKVAKASYDPNFLKR